MNLFGFRKQQTHMAQLTKLANYVAKRSARQVRVRLGVHVSEMSAAEARGYIRARAASIVSRQSPRACDHPSWSAQRSWSSINWRAT
jgi:hypothetical protein